MYLRFDSRISPKRVAAVVQPELAKDALQVDRENIYEWAYIDLHGASFSLDVTRDHGMSEIDDDELDQMTEDELEHLPSAGPTYAFGLDRKTDSYVEEIPEWMIKFLCEKTRSAITVFPGKITVDAQDPEPIAEYKP